MEEHDEIIIHIEEKPFFLNYEGCMRIHDDGLLTMIWERDEVD